MTYAILDGSDAGIVPASPTKLLGRRAIFYQEVAEVDVGISQGSPPVAT